VTTQAQAMNEGALIRALPTLATLVVTGSERQSWLAGMLTADIAGLTPGRGCYALSVGKTGRIQADVWVLVEAERILLGVPESLAAGLHKTLNDFLIMEDAELELGDVRHGWWLAHGPAAATVADAARTAGASAAVAQLGEIATAILAAPPAVNNFIEVITQVPGTLLATPDGWERIRIENMLPRFGVDFDVGSFPQEACLENLAVSFNKGCYLGQEAVFMLEKRGHVNKRLVRLVLDEELALDKGASVAAVQPDKDDEEKVVGEVTSSIADGGRTWVIALVRYKYTQNGTALRIGERAATVSCLSSRERACA
jgi:tRNA-modifying protein YgfZ